MKTDTRQEIKELINKAILTKLDKYSAETIYKPFFTALFDDKIILQASIIQSIYTTFGMSIYEQIAIILARANGFTAERQYTLLGRINDETLVLIERICDEPIGTFTKQQEIDDIRKVIVKGSASKHSDSTVDVYLLDPKTKIVTFIDITTVKPNKKESRALRRKLLIWSALAYSQDPTIIVKTFIGIPYNPYFPEEYSRSFVRSNCHRDEVLVQNDLWRLFAGYDVFDDLLEIFKEVGLEIQTKIDHFLGK